MPSKKSTRNTVKKINKKASKKTVKKDKAVKKSSKTPIKSAYKKHKESTFIAKIDPSKLDSKKKKYYDMLINLRNHILNQVKTLSEEALSTGADTGEHSSALSNHLADYGSDNFLHNMELDIMTGEMEDIEMIDEAIERLFTGEYGKCLDCGCNISEERLKAKPHARYCVKCKTEREKNPDLNER